MGLGMRPFGQQHAQGRDESDRLIQHDMVARMRDRNEVVCLPKSGPVFELVPAPIMELRHGQESQA